MALAQCSECGKLISDQAAACPGCGLPLKPAAPQAPNYGPPPFTGPAPHHIKGRGWLVALACVACFGVGIVVGREWLKWEISQAIRSAFTRDGEQEHRPPHDTRASPETAAAPATGGDIGVADCDEYIRKMSDCAGKMQPEAAGPMKESMETMNKAWRDAASTPEGRVALASGCRQALAAAKSAYRSMGCQF